MKMGERIVNKLEQIGSQHEVEVILCIPLVRNGGQKELIWNQNSVKSGYWLALKEGRTCWGNQNGIPVVNERWRRLWKLKPPPKMSHFWLRCSTGFIHASLLYLWLNGFSFYVFKVSTSVGIAFTRYISMSSLCRCWRRRVSFQRRAMVHGIL